MPELYQSLPHSKWDCKCHIVFAPKRWRKVISGQTRRHLGADFPCAGPAKEVPDYRRASNAGPCAHVYCDSPKHAVASVIEIPFWTS
jgi:putative transposase